MTLFGAKAPWPQNSYLLAAAFLVVGAIAVLSLTLADELDQLDTAQSDNVQWTITQSEVEFLEFSQQLDLAIVQEDRDLSTLKLRFDVFYSRIGILETASTYKVLKQIEIYQDALQTVRAFLDETVPLIDGDDTTLRAALPEIAEKLKDTRPRLRTVANSALDFFASASDEQRQSLSRTLLLLAILIVMLFFALALTILYLGWLNARTSEREREVAQTAMRMDTVIRTSLDGVVVADEDGCILAFNAAAEVIFGHKAEDVLGASLGPLIVPDHMLDAHDAGMARMRKGGEKRVVGKGRVKLEGKRSDGSLFPVELAIQSAETDDGTIFIAFLRDISASVAAEKELISARDQALAADRLKTEFLATMSHEIRTPLNGLLGNLNLIQDTRLSPQQKRYISNMETSGDLLLQHVTDVLDITRYDVGQINLRADPINLSKFIQSVVDSQSARAANNNTTIEWHWKGEPMPWVLSDRDRLQHVLINLIGNAVKFTQDGRVTVSISATARPVGLTSFAIRVSDTGCGMDELLLSRIFDDFVTGTVAYDRDVGGTGLGLGIVRRSVTALDGTISVQSEVGVGSVFDVVLPMQSTDPVANEPGTAGGVDAVETVPILNGLHILIVEDNEINRAVTSEMLRIDGHLTTQVNDGAAAVELTLDTPFDLILMDISMPVMDGRTATRAIRNGDGVCKRTPIVALTANALETERKSFLEDGMNGVLIKPLSRSALRREVQNIAAEGMRNDLAPPPNPNVDEMRDVLGEKRYGEMLSKFRIEVQGLLSWFETSSKPDASDIASRCHKIAGSAAIFGAIELREALIAIEDACKVGRVDTLPDRIRELRKKWSEALVGFDAE